ncbi:alpha/beta hydrolase [Streptomyces sp. XM4193]|uniref:alpha/beta fold hydrolase n=1 Tax=Streptomyces sp. XM4193 TaxID=2929782 RepID=UPI001FFAD054|nr:alpha/beta hydrolase [Streptomyces sp. XM4193]MCK1796813.1 alpha/beta hydrolase [Streptomyces sp. XM4193]
MTRPHHVTQGPFAPPAPVREQAVASADGVELYVQVHGPEGGPAVVLAHGWTCSTAFWAPIVRSLVAEGHRVVVYDQRGHGLTTAGLEGRPTGYSPATLADDLCAVLDATLEPGEQAVVGGHSMGGMTIMAAAGRAQLREHAAALMLCSTGARSLPGTSTVIPMPGARARELAHRATLGAAAPFGPITPLSKALIRYVTMGAGVGPEARDAAVRIVHSAPRRPRAAWGRVLSGLDLHAKLRDLDVPTAVVHGTHDRLTPFAHAVHLAENLPHLTELHKLSGLGHMTPMEAPEAVAGVLRRLAAAHLATPASPADTSTTSATSATSATEPSATEPAGGASAGGSSVSEEAA